MGKNWNLKTIKQWRILLVYSLQDGSEKCILLRKHVMGRTP